MRTIKLALLFILFLSLAGVISAQAASNTVQVSRRVDSNRSVTANDLKPIECASLNLSSIFNTARGGKLNSANNLILGTADGDSMQGMDGEDCIIGGAGDDIVSGNGREQKGNDIILGGPGNDRLFGGKGNDIIYGGDGSDYCDGGGGQDTFFSCEQIVN